VFLGGCRVSLKRNSFKINDLRAGSFFHPITALRLCGFAVLRLGAARRPRDRLLSSRPGRWCRQILEHGAASCRRLRRMLSCSCKRMREARYQFVECGELLLQVEMRLGDVLHVSAGSLVRTASSRTCSMGRPKTDTDELRRAWPRRRDAAVFPMRGAVDARPTSSFAEPSSR
jgi:hypothetical protein